MGIQPDMPGMFPSPFLRKQESSRLWYRHGFRVKPGMVMGIQPDMPGMFPLPFLRKQESSRLWYRHGFRVKPGMVMGGGIAMDSRP